jgi:hypothetical protein
MSENEPKDCPFCGEKPQGPDKWEPVDGPTNATIFCCARMTHALDYSWTVEHLVTEWNRRPVEAALVAEVEQLRERVANQAASIEALVAEKRSMQDNRDFLGSLAIALLVRIGGDAVLTDLEITGEPKTERNLRVTAETEGRFCAHVETRPVAPEPLDESGPEFD